MTYQSLSAELEQEQSSLEDLHMFFVAFHRRRKQIIEQTEPTEKGKTPSELRFALVGGQENIGDAG